MVDTGFSTSESEPRTQALFWLVLGLCVHWYSLCQLASKSGCIMKFPLPRGHSSESNFDPNSIGHVAEMAGSTVKVNIKGLEHDCFSCIFLFQIGIIGGSGLDDPDIIQNRKEVEVDTPYGKVFRVHIKLCLFTHGIHQMLDHNDPACRPDCMCVVPNLMPPSLCRTGW